MTNEDSAVVALSHLRQLEADRVRREQQARQAAAEAERQAAEEVAASERALAEQRAAERAAREHDERMAQLERERQERLRVAEAEARARAEHDARLRQEQMRLEAQVRLSERRAAPRWPLAVVPVLVLGLVGAGAMAWHGQRVAERDAASRARAQMAAASATDAIDRVNAKLDALQAEQKRLNDQRAALESRLAEAADDDASREELLEKLAAVEGQLEDNEQSQKGAGQRPTRRKPPRTARTPKPTAEPGPKPKPRTRPTLEVGDSNDPLAGLVR